MLAAGAMGGVEVIRVIVQLCRFLRGQGFQQHHGTVGERYVIVASGGAGADHNQKQYADADQCQQRDTDALALAYLRSGAKASVQQIPPALRDGAENGIYAQHQIEGGQKYRGDRQQRSAIQQHIVKAVVELHIPKLIPKQIGDQQDQHDTGTQLAPVGGFDGIPQGVFVGVDLHRIGPRGPVDIRPVVQLIHILPAQLPHGLPVFLPPGVVAVLWLDMDAVAGGGFRGLRKDSIFIAKAPDAYQLQALLGLFIQPRLQRVHLIPCEGHLFCDVVFALTHSGVSFLTLAGEQI